MANRVLEFPVRNAFAPRRSHDSPARDTRTPSDHAHRIAQRVDNEISRQASRLATGRSSFCENERRTPVTMPARTRTRRLRTLMGVILASVRVFSPR